MGCYGCTGCGLCSDVCSMSLTLGGKFSPEKKLISCEMVINGNYKPSDIKSIFQCTKCRACEEVCPEDIKITDIIDDARGKYVSEKGVKFGGQRELIKNTLQYGTPFGIAGSRISFPKEQYSDKSDTLLFIGCYSSYVSKDIAAAGFNIIKKLDIEFTILGKEEPCCGYFIYNTGDHKTAKRIIEKNERIFKEKDIKRIITLCPGCTRFLTTKYDMDVEVIHISKVISAVMKDRNIPFKRHSEMVAFHDACNIGRSLGIYQEPRNMIIALGYKLVEMELSKERAICCGADGGMKIVFPGLSIEIGKIRLNGLAKGCNKLFTICPFCLSNLREASNKYKMGIEILNLLVAFNQSLI